MYGILIRDTLDRQCAESVLVYRDPGTSKCYLFHILSFLHIVL